MLNAEQVASILDHYKKKGSHEELLRSLSLTPANIVAKMRETLGAAIDAGDLYYVTDVCHAAYILKGERQPYFDLRPYLDVIARLFGPHLHRHPLHEELVRDLQDMADPAGIPILRDAIALKPTMGWEGDYTSDRVFFQRCSHALREIDTPESLLLIEECSRSTNDALRDEGLKRLLKIEPGDEKPLAITGEGGAGGTPDAEPGTGKSLGDLVYGASETSGVENLRLVHSLIVEACQLYSARCGYDVYSEILALVEAPGTSLAHVMHRERWFVRLYLFLSVNVRRPVMSLDDLDDFQATPLYEICEMLRHDGAAPAEVAGVFQRAIANVEQHALPAVYRQSAHVLNEGYDIADGNGR